MQSQMADIYFSPLAGSQSGSPPMQDESGYPYLPRSHQDYYRQRMMAAVQWPTERTQHHPPHLAHLSLQHEQESQQQGLQQSQVQQHSQGHPQIALPQPALPPHGALGAPGIYAEQFDHYKSMQQPHTQQYIFDRRGDMSQQQHVPQQQQRDRMHGLNNLNGDNMIFVDQNKRQKMGQAMYADSVPAGHFGAPRFTDATRFDDDRFDSAAATAARDAYGRSSGYFNQEHAYGEKLNIGSVVGIVNQRDGVNAVNEPGAPPHTMRKRRRTSTEEKHRGPIENRVDSLMKTIQSAQQQDVGKANGPSQVISRRDGRQRRADTASDPASFDINDQINDDEVPGGVGDERGVEIAKKRGRPAKNRKAIEILSALAQSQQQQDTKRRPYTCPRENCGKSFTQAANLRMHLQSHDGQKPFKCEHCHKSFSQSGNLKTHVRRHTGERPFVCTYEGCEKKFAQQGNLRAHMLTHEGTKPFICRLDDCSRRFSQLGNLKIHQNKFHAAAIAEIGQKIASANSRQLSEKDVDLIEYFAKLYKNSNKGIKGRGKKEDDIRPVNVTSVLDDSTGQ